MSDKQTEFRADTAVPKGTMEKLLRDAYSFEPRYERDFAANWQESDLFFAGHPEIADRCCFFTAVDEVPAGMICWDPRRLPEQVEIGHNCVAASYKRQGLGQKQLREAIRRIGLTGCKKILVTTDERLVPAQHNYEHAGFHRAGIRENACNPEYAGYLIDYYMLAKAPVIRTDRLVLRAFTSADRDDLVRLLRNSQVAETYLLPDFPDDAAACPMFNRIRDLSQNPFRFVYAIDRAGQAIGLINETSGRNDTVELGYALLPEFWNQGYMTEALGACIAELQRLGFLRIRASCFEKNTASARVMEKNGMTITGETESVFYRGQTHTCVYREFRQK